MKAKKFSKISAGVLGGIILIIVAIMAIRTATVKSQQVETNEVGIKTELDENQLAEHLSEALKCKTVSYTDPNEFDYSEFIKLHLLIDKSYPNINKNLKKEVINNYSLLYTWEGSDKSLKPLILTAHMDVVGVDENTDSEWKHEPFSGEIADGKIWGRGARDNKCQVFSILEAAEFLISNGFQPKRTIYFAFGHDEEVLGINGAAKIAETLKQRGVTPECVIDEGGAIVDNIAPGVDKKVALIGTAEKGYLTLKLTARAEEGHSASPPKDSSIGILSNAIVRLNSYKFEPTLSAMAPMFTSLAHEAKFPYNVLYSNLWISNGLFKKIMSSDPDTDSCIRTTIALTMFNSGFKDNVMPSNASATINLRLMPRDNVDDIQKKIVRIIDDERITVEKSGFSNNPLPVSPTDNEDYKTIQKSIKQIFPDSISVPYFVNGGTDMKHYGILTDKLYRFTPSIKEKDEESHGINERITIENYKQYAEFYVKLINIFN